MTKNYNSLQPIETAKISLRLESNHSTKSGRSQPESVNIIVFATCSQESNSNKCSTPGTIPFDLSREFSKSFQDIETYTKKLINYLGKPIDSAWIMSECYIYLHNNLALLDTSRKMISYAKNWIKCNLKWTNSPLNRQIRLNNIPSDSPDIPGTSGVYLFDSETILDQIQDFSSGLNQYDRRLFHIYYEMDLRKGKDIANHLAISISSAYPIIKECKQLELKLRNHIKLNTLYA